MLIWGIFRVRSLFRECFGTNSEMIFQFWFLCQASGFEFERVARSFGSGLSEVRRG